jgi:hypothetical protein
MEPVRAERVRLSIADVMRSASLTAETWPEEAATHEARRMAAQRKVLRGLRLRLWVAIRGRFVIALILLSGVAPKMDEPWDCRVLTVQSPEDVSAGLVDVLFQAWVYNFRTRRGRGVP